VSDAAPTRSRVADRALPRPSPVCPGDPIVTLGEGSTPLVLAERLSERVGAEVHLKLEGLNPTGSFKDRGMTCAVSAAMREGAQAVICASTGNTAASAAAYAAKAGLRGVVIIPDGKIATGKLAQALMHGARVIALARQLRPGARPGSTARRAPPDRARQLRQRVSPAGPEDRRLRAARRPRRAARRALHTGRERRQHHRLLEGLRRGRQRAADARLPGRGRRADRERRAGCRARDGRQRDPDRQSGALGGGDRRDARLPRRDPRRHRRRDPLRLPPARRDRGRVLRAGLRSVGRRPHQVRRRGRRARRLRPHWPRPEGPEAALEQAGAVLPCEPQLRAIERAVLG